MLTAKRTAHNNHRGLIYSFHYTLLPSFSLLKDPTGKPFFQFSIKAHLVGLSLFTVIPDEHGTSATNLDSF